VCETVEFKSLVNVIRATRCDVPTRKTLRKHCFDVAENYRQKVLLVVTAPGAVCTLALDGWTNTIGQKVTNLLIVCNGKAYYWTSVCNEFEHNTAQWLEKQFVPIIDDLKEKQVMFGGVSLDNEATSLSFFDCLQHSFDWILHLPCVAHLMQLCVRDLLKHVDVNAAVQCMLNILQQVKSDKEVRLKLYAFARAMAIGVHKVIKPNATRWNSVLTSLT
jgi:hypothetical protein